MNSTMWPASPTIEPSEETVQTFLASIHHIGVETHLRLRRIAGQTDLPESPDGYSYSVSNTDGRQFWTFWEPRSVNRPSNDIRETIRTYLRNNPDFKLEELLSIAATERPCLVRRQSWEGTPNSEKCRVGFKRPQGGSRLQMELVYGPVSEWRRRQSECYWLFDSDILPPRLFPNRSANTNSAPAIKTEDATQGAQEAQEAAVSPEVKPEPTFGSESTMDQYESNDFETLFGEGEASSAVSFNEQDSTQEPTISPRIKVGPASVPGTPGTAWAEYENFDLGSFFTP